MARTGGPCGWKSRGWRSAFSWRRRGWDTPPPVRGSDLVYQVLVDGLHLLASGVWLGSLPLLVLLLFCDAARR